MAKYVVHYDMRKGNTVSSSSKTVECEEESTAIQSAEQQAKAQRPEHTFVLKRVETRN